MNRYLIGTVVGAADDFGPAAGGTHYTDTATIMAVQAQLKRMGYYNGSIDGVFGPQTEKALFIVTGQHGPPDDAALAKVGVKPGGQLASGAAPLPTAAPGTPQLAPSKPSTKPAMMTASFWARPLWNGAPVKRWQAGLGLLGGITLSLGIVSAIRR